MNKRDREIRFSHALSFADRYTRDDSAEEATGLVLVFAALEPLGFEARCRIVRAALARFGIPRERL